MAHMQTLPTLLSYTVSLWSRKIKNKRPRIFVNDCRMSNNSHSPKRITQERTSLEKISNSAVILWSYRQLSYGPGIKSSPSNFSAIWLHAPPPPPLPACPATSLFVNFALSPQFPRDQQARNSSLIREGLLHRLALMRAICYSHQIKLA